MFEIITVILEEVLADLIAKGAKYIIRKATDAFGNVVTEIVYPVDEDGDGVTDYEETIYSFDSLIPEFVNGFCLCNKGDEIGIGMPQLRIIDYEDMAGKFLDTITGTPDGYVRDDNGKVFFPAPYDATGDGQPDWYEIIDEDDNGVPDASDIAPFYPVGSEGYNRFIKQYKSNSQVDFIMLAPDGTMTVYDQNGNITAEDVDNAYALWVSENGIMTKKLDNYSVSEGLLLCLLIVSGVFFLRSLFKRKDVFR